jgi:hypothetical protein
MEPGYSAQQIEVVTHRLLAMLRESEALGPLFVVAVQQNATEKNRFKKRLYRLLKIYSGNLKVEARESLEFLAARLVSHKARFLATAIAGNNPEQSPTLSHDAHYSQPTNYGLKDEVDAGDEEGGEEQHIAECGDVIGEFTQVKDFL